MLRATLLVLLLTSLLPACGESPAPGRPKDADLARFFHPADDALHVQPIDPNREAGHLPTTPDLRRGSIDIATPGPGWVTLRLLAAPVPEDAGLLEAVPGVAVLFESAARTRNLGIGDEGPHTCRVRWAFHVTSGLELVKGRLDGLHPYVPKMLEPGGDAGLERAWQENVLAEWWCSVGVSRVSWRGWSHDEWAVPRVLKHGARSSSSGMPVAGQSSFSTRRADQPIVLETYSWMWLRADRGTEDFVEARKRWRFRALREDSSVELGDETFRPEASPFLTWRLVLQWTPEDEGKGTR